MKKILTTISIVILIAILIIALYSKYVEIRINEYMRFATFVLENTMGMQAKNLAIERVIKKSPKEIIILVKWNDNSAFISIKDWLLLRFHEEIEIRVFDSKKGIHFYE